MRSVIAGFAAGFVAAGVLVPALSLAAEAPSAGTVSPTAAMAAIAQGFYTAYSALPVGGVPDDSGRASLEPFLSPALTQLLADADDAEESYAEATHNENPPLLENDPFTSMFEGATAFQVGKCVDDGNAGTCAINLTYDDNKAKPTKWTDTADLVLTDKGWRIDDIEYGGTWDFALKGKLTDVLKDVIDQSKNPD